MISITLPKDYITLRVSDIGKAPQYGGVYYLFNKHRHVIYIGKTYNFRKRMMQHRSKSYFFPNVYYMRFFRADSPLERELYETHAINKRKPYYNKAKVFNDDDYAEKQAEYCMVADQIDELVAEISALNQNRRRGLYDADMDYGENDEEYCGDANELQMMRLGQSLYEDSYIEELRKERDHLRSRLKTLSFYAN